MQQLADLLAGIRRASQDQHAGIAQVKQTIVQMEASTQRNASLVEEAGASTAQMQAQVHALAEAVGAFRLRSMPQARGGLSSAGGCRPLAGTTEVQYTSRR